MSIKEEISPRVQAVHPAHESDSNPIRSIKNLLQGSWSFSYWTEEWKPLVVGLIVFLGCYYLPVGNARFDRAVLEAFALVKWYAQEHASFCLLPAFFIAGAIAVFVSQEGVMRYLGPAAPKYLSYPVASISGSILAVCSCTVLPLLPGYRAGGQDWDRQPRFSMRALPLTSLPSS